MFVASSRNRSTRCGRHPALPFAVTQPRSAVLRIGCAGWSLSTAQGALAPGEGSHLERYARLFDAVEINSSFYRPHRPQTYARWAQ